MHIALTTTYRILITITSISTVFVWFVNTKKLIATIAINSLQNSSEVFIFVSHSSIGRRLTRYCQSGWRMHIFTLCLIQNYQVYCFSVSLYNFYVMRIFMRNAYALIYVLFWPIILNMAKYGQNSMAWNERIRYIQKKYNIHPFWHAFLSSTCS